MSEARTTVEELQKENADQQAKIATLEETVQQLGHKIQRLLRELAGKKSEKINADEILDGCREFFTPEELALFPAEPESEEEPDLPEDKPRKKRKRNQKKLIPDELPREIIDVPLPEDRCQCPACDAEMKSIGFETVEKLGFRPASFYAQEFRLEKRACSCGQGIATATVPPQPVPKGKAAPDLLAHVIVSKFVDHLPFYRLSRILARHGIAIPDTTLVEWSKQVGDLLVPIVFLMTKELLAGDYIQADETGLPVIVKGNGKCHSAYLWGYSKPGGNAIFDFRMSRGRDGPRDFLADFRGKLQSDGYAGYDETKKRDDITWFACMAHARRYFVDARDTAQARCDKVLRYMQGLYRVEKHARDRELDPSARRELRQRQSKPLLAALKKYLEEISPGALPKSPLGKAIAYTSKRWEDLERYVDHGDVEIDNNLQENAFRGIAVGRRNWLFAGSEAGGHKAACLYSIVETCRRIGIDPREYLTDCLTRIPGTPVNQLKELTPLRWKAQRDFA